MFNLIACFWTRRLSDTVISMTDELFVKCLEVLTYILLLQFPERLPINPGGFALKRALFNRPKTPLVYE